MTNIALVIFDIDGVIRDVTHSYRRAIADTVEQFTNSAYRPTMNDIDQLKGEGIWNNDWKASEELIYRYFEQQGQTREQIKLDYSEIIHFFQSRYRGKHPEDFDGYITTEPILASKSYLEQLSQNQIDWGFFSGATRGSAEYILKKRIGLDNPVLIAMEDAPGKPDPTGLFATIQQLEGDLEKSTPVIYVGDTVADMLTVIQAQTQAPERTWLGVGVLPPHIHHTAQEAEYSQKLMVSGAIAVLHNVEQLTAIKIKELLVR